MDEKSLKVSESVWQEAKAYSFNHNCKLQSFVESAIKEKISREQQKPEQPQIEQRLEHPKPEPLQQQPQAEIQVDQQKAETKPQPEEEDPYMELRKVLNQK